MLERLINVLKKYTDETDITLESNIKDDLGLDSLGLVDVAAAMEDEFDIEISDDVALNIVTVEDFLKIIEG